MAFKSIILVSLLLLLTVQFNTQAQTAEDPLVTLLINKGLLTKEDAQTILAAGNTAQQRDRLAVLLKDKGLISATEFEALRGPAKTVAANSVAVNEAPPKTSTPPPRVIPAVAPVRLLSIDPPQREGLIPDLKLGSGARIKPYGYFKTSVIHDSSSPQGNDFPLPLLATDTGPNGSPEFHLKARALRLGVNFEWLDPAPKTTITGRLEVDFEGDFTRVNNRNISSIRSSQPSLRLAWARIDRRLNEKINGFALFGQDWTPFVSSTLPNTIENTNFGGIGYGAAYERAPQIRTGFNYNFGGARSWKIQPEFAIVFPAFGDVPTNVADQLGFGERQGADSSRPASQGRVVVQWQLDKAEASCRGSSRRCVVAAICSPETFKYKLNSWVTFGFEEGYYRTRATNHSATDFGGLPLFRGIPSYTTHNVRSEFATIFTF